MLAVEMMRFYRVSVESRAANNPQVLSGITWATTSSQHKWSLQFLDQSGVVAAERGASG